MTSGPDLNNDLSTWSRRVFDFLQQARSLGIPLRVVILFEDGDNAIELASYSSSSARPPLSELPIALRDGQV